jgi:putative Holliday junction resolvase
MRVLGIDPGGKRLGLAIGDLQTGLASPLAVLPYRGRRHAAAAIAAAVRQHGAALVVIGLPTDLDGKETPACGRSHALAEALAELGIDAQFQAEVLTTDEARRRARTVGRHASDPVDDLAAQVIVEEFLAGHRQLESKR